MCATRTERLQTQLRDPTAYCCFTLMLTPQINAYVSDATINLTLFEWRHNRRLVFIDGKGEGYQISAPEDCFFSFPSAVSFDPPSLAGSVAVYPPAPSATAAASSSAFISFVRQSLALPNLPPVQDRVQFFSLTDAASLANLWR
jgi:hypothetical protein